MGRWDGLYARLPVAGQHFAVSAYGYYWRRLRFGAAFEGALAIYRARDRWNTTEWKAHQASELGRVLPMAASEVPYYRTTWRESERRAAAAGRLSELPLLPKEPIRGTPEAFVRDSLRGRRLLRFHTSGSSGTPIQSIWTAAELQASMALREARSASWAGVSFREPRATFSGRIVEPDPESSGPYYRFNAAERQVYFSAFHLRPRSARLYVDALWKHRVAWLTGYAVSYFLLARMVLEQNIAVPPLKAVITTSEKVTREMRDVMETAYKCRVYEEYSSVENALFASECERGRLHVSPDAGIVEILRPDGSPCAPGETGEVVATCFIRTSQPFIRYRLGDLARWSAETCPCGRAMPVLEEVVGRIEDLVVGPDGREMVRFHGIFIDQPHIREGQIVQEALDRIRVRVVPTDGFGPADESEIQRRVTQRLGPRVDVIVETVGEIPRTAAGKLQAVISKIPSGDRNRIESKTEPGS
jgi:phenylacetate-CoA ligase